MKLTVAPENPLEWLALQTNQVPIPLLHIQMYFVMAKAVMEAADLGVFECIRNEEKTVEQIADETTLHPKALRQLLNVLVSMGYLHFEDGKFSLTKMAKKWILPSSTDSVHHIAVYNNRVAWDWVGQMGQYLRTGEGKNSHEIFNKTQWALYQNAMHSVAAGEVKEFIRRVPVPKNAKNILDIGGANGQHVLALCKKYTNLTATILDLPEAIEQAPPLLDPTLSERITYQVGNALADDFGVEKYDLILFSNLAHHFTAEQNQSVIEKATKALKIGGFLIINEFIRPDLNGKPEIVGASSDLFFGITSTSGNWTVAEIQHWQKSAGLSSKKTIHYITIPGMAMVVGEKR